MGERVNRHSGAATGMGRAVVDVLNNYNIRAIPPKRKLATRHHVNFDGTVIAYDTRQQGFFTDKVNGHNFDGAAHSKTARS